MNLQSNSAIRIMYVQPLLNASSQPLEKSQFVAFIECLKGFELKFLGAKVSIQDLEARLTGPLNVQQDRTSRICYTLPQLTAPTDDYLLIGRVCGGQEKPQDSNAFMYIKHELERDVLKVGFFELKDSLVNLKADYAEIGFRADS